MTHRKVYEQLAQLLEAIEGCQTPSKRDWALQHRATAEAIVKDGPHGGGIDCGATLDFERSRPNFLVFTTAFHHMNDHGVYDGWTNHHVTVKPSLARGFDLSVHGVNRNEIKDYLADVFGEWLGSTGV